MKLLGQSILGDKRGLGNGATFLAVNPTTGKSFDPVFYSATMEDVHAAAELAEEAVAVYGKLSGKEKGTFLRNIAKGIEGAAEEIVERAHEETALPRKRLQGEITRTANQLRLFAEVVEDGSWVMARIDTADANRAPLPRPDIRSLLHPLGPVVVFGASNFPLAFSVAGGDTASALAAGNPVIVKAHPAHPGTSELVGEVICQSVRDCHLPPGVFSLLFDAGTQVGTALVQHPVVKAVGFTGSLAAGKALMQLAWSRPEPIPCFAEMSSTNPLFVLPEALRARGPQIAAGLYGSFTLGSGQFCTKPGIVFLPRDSHADTFVEVLEKNIAESSEFLMLTGNIRAHYQAAAAERQKQKGVQVLTNTSLISTGGPFGVSAMLLQVNGEGLLQDSGLAKEMFGPSTLVVRYSDREQLLELARSLEGHLTATLQATESDIAKYADLIALLERKVGRLIVNGYPTGVEVSHAMVHGGPYPATSDGRSTSVGSQAIYRFVRPVCYQDFPQFALPDELKDDNPLHIWRMVNGNRTTDAVKG